jgi:hypothetical protein
MSLVQFWLRPFAIDAGSIRSLGGATYWLNRGRQRWLATAR